MLDLIEQYQPIGMIAGVEPLTRRVLGKATNLKIISRCGVGLDTVDMKAATEFGIKVTITPDAPVPSVAELTIGMTLSLLRKLKQLDMAVRNGSWKGPQGSLLLGKTIGIAGCGRIGTYVAKLFTAFGCEVLGYDPVLKKHDVCEMVSWEDLLKKSDVITLHIPYSQENHHIIGRDQFKAMKKDVILVNAARGGLVDEKALYDALKNGEIAGACLDCFEEEPYNGPLKELENTLLTAHMGSSAKEARYLMEQQAAGNLLEGLKTVLAQEQL